MNFFPKHIDLVKTSMNSNMLLNAKNEGVLKPQFALELQ